jgi:methionyl-tRNA synthetase
VRGHLSAHQIQKALVATWDIITRGNQYVDQTAPFKLAKDPAQKERLDAVLYNLAELCRIVGILQRPVLPDTSTKILAQLGFPEGKPAAEVRWGELAPGHKIGAPSPLFPRKDLEKS